MRKPYTDEQRQALKARMVNRKEKAPVKILPITDKYRLVSDLIEIRIEEKNKGGNWVITGHHSNLPSAVESLLNHVVKDDIDSLLTVMRNIDKVKSVVSSYENLKAIDIKY